MILNYCKIMVHPIYDKEIYKYRVSRNKWIDYKWKANNCILQCLSILNEENYREFVEAENMELLSNKIIEYSKKK